MNGNTQSLTNLGTPTIMIAYLNGACIQPE